MRFVPKTITRTIGRQILLTKKNSPHIAFGVGVVGVIGAGVMACRATLKLEDTIDAVKADVDHVKMKKNTTDVYVGDEGESEFNRQLTVSYGRGALAVGRLYAPAFIVGAASIGALTGSHVSLTRRNAALTAAFATVSAAYEEYRNRVREELGPERELALYHSVSEEVVKVNGEKQVQRLVDPNARSPYSRFFDETSRYWEKDPELNRLWVQSQQNYLNNLLQVRGHVFLNEAYDALGIDRSSPGSVVGWVIGKDGDNYIDFGMFEAGERGRAFVNGWERTLLLDFNVDGVIYDKI